MVDLSRFDFLFKPNNPVSKNILKNIFEGILEALDEKGTVACAVPRPWYAKGFLAHGKSVFLLHLYLGLTCVTGPITFIFNCWMKKFPHDNFPRRNRVASGFTASS